MSSQGPPKYLCRRVIYELRRHGLGRHHIPPDFFSSRLYRDVLDSLDVSKIPKTSASERDQWLNIVNAADSISAIGHLIWAGATGFKTPSAACTRIMADSMSSVWAWALYMHPFVRNCDEDALEAATELYKWHFSGRKGWHYAAICDAIFAFADRTDTGTSALLAFPGSVSYMYDLWWYMMHVIGGVDPADGIVATLVLLSSGAPNQQVAGEIVAKGSLGVDALVRRFYALLNMRDPDFYAVHPIVHLIARCAAACDDATRRKLRPLLWEICPLIRLADLHSSEAEAQTLGYLVTFSANCFCLLSCISIGLGGTRDIIRLIRQGLLQAIFDFINRYSKFESSIASNILNDIIAPASCLPSVAAVVNDAIQRHNLRPSADDDKFEAWHAMCASLDKLAAAKDDYMAEKKANRFCHNKSCIPELVKKLKRCPCGYVYYCSKSCQTLDWERHREICQNRDYCPDLQEFRIHNPSDVRFLRFLAYQYLPVRDISRETSNKDTHAAFQVDFSSSAEPKATVVESGENRKLTVIVGTFKAKTTLSSASTSTISDPSQNANAMSYERQCSVKGCTNILPPDQVKKMCDACREKHRGYATTKRARRKQEKAVLNGLVGPLEGGQDSATWDQTPGASTSQVEASHETQEVQTAQLSQPSTSQMSPWGNSIDPALYAQGTIAYSLGPSNYRPPPQSELARALTYDVPPGPSYHQSPRFSATVQGVASSITAQVTASPIVVHATEAEVHRKTAESAQLQILPSQATSTAPSGPPNIAPNSSAVIPRFCSVKGCKNILPGDYEFKMCVPCRDKYKKYGETKRAKWKSEREQLERELAALRAAEDARRRAAGMPALSENADELYAWEKAIVDSRIPLSERRRSSAALANRNVEVVSPQVGGNCTQVGDNSAQAGDHNAQANGSGSNVTHDLTTSSVDPQPIDMATTPGATIFSPSSSPYQAASPAVRMCTVSHCHQVLPREYQYKRCVQHRVQNRHHSTLKRVRERAAKEAGPDADAALTPGAADSALTSGAANMPDVVQAALRRMAAEGAMTTDDVLGEETAKGGEGVIDGEGMAVATTGMTGAASEMTAEGGEATAMGEEMNVDGAGDESMDEMRVVEELMRAAPESVGQDETAYHPATEHSSMPPPMTQPASAATSTDATTMATADASATPTKQRPERKRKKKSHKKIADQKRRQVCSGPGCYNLMDIEQRWRMCDLCRKRQREGRWQGPLVEGGECGESDVEDAGEREQGEGTSTGEQADADFRDEGSMDIDPPQTATPGASTSNSPSTSVRSNTSSTRDRFSKFPWPPPNGVYQRERARRKLSAKARFEADKASEAARKEAEARGEVSKAFSGTWPTGPSTNVYPYYSRDATYQPSVYVSPSYMGYTPPIGAPSSSTASRPAFARGRAPDSAPHPASPSQASPTEPDPPGSLKWSSSRSFTPSTFSHPTVEASKQGPPATSPSTDATAPASQPATPSATYTLATYPPYAGWTPVAYTYSPAPGGAYSHHYASHSSQAPPSAQPTSSPGYAYPSTSYYPPPHYPYAYAYATYPPPTSTDGTTTAGQCPSPYPYAYPAPCPYSCCAPTNAGHTPTPSSSAGIGITGDPIPASGPAPEQSSSAGNVDAANKTDTSQETVRTSRRSAASRKLSSSSKQLSSTGEAVGNTQDTASTRLAVIQTQASTSQTSPDPAHDDGSTTLSNGEHAERSRSRSEWSSDYPRDYPQPGQYHQQWQSQRHDGPGESSSPPSATLAWLAGKRGAARDEHRDSEGAALNALVPPAPPSAVYEGYGSLSERAVIPARREGRDADNEDISPKRRRTSGGFDDQAASDAHPSSSHDVKELDPKCDAALAPSTTAKECSNPACHRPALSGLLCERCKTKLKKKKLERRTKLHLQPKRVEALQSLKVVSASEKDGLSAS
ncbi:uncharacterized protein SCHCODRAFT_02553159 [Schizophyllum commune H4-8]|uniref:uncharacterized protein n=1 Tax=Schizophyllum commune (strain H4-8 / FGSC 9210) TaxID=578458 RepID=UPI0021603DD6|nr:uncharacterized protein SCHCODRAFT_02553159 [Schizophyllum commune H4-8]KAI5887837.1 hypothetical protein SCHCODRAFT_02553159 [Schizophyllum commune H4-8]